MTPFTPSHSFRLRHKEDATVLAQAVDSKWLRVGLDYALAQIAHDGATDMELRGINRFIGVFLTQATEAVTPSKLPDKSRLPSYESEGPF